ncbi:MAG: hypothetical protein LBP40_08610 [Campylobacteraceae bacterium]|jgi:Leucine-rich repeat (LRR) protein|nr:hypothetical protein [Campylobacteraceae bacterium]
MIAAVITTLVSILALGMIIYVSSYKRYDLNSWSGALMKWADDNNVSRKRMPRYDEKTLLKIIELDLSEFKLPFLPEEICYLAKLKKLHLRDNNLTSLPENITSLKLSLLDVRGNNGLKLNSKQKTWAREIKEFYSDDLINLKK